MVKGRNIRIPVKFEATIIYKKKEYEAKIENLSEEGMQIRTNPVKAAIDFEPGTVIELEFELLSGETLKPAGEILKLNCKVIWSGKSPPDDLKNTIGLEIIEKSLQYEEFLKSLHINYMGIM
ncbi:MAG: PilZ domain-containing protein [Candidatus Mariimomonas ferrooxydans]